MNKVKNTMSEISIIGAIEENLFEYIRLFAKNGVNDFHEDKEVLRFISDINIPSMQSNSIYKLHFNENQNIDSALSLALKPFRDGKKPLFLTAGPSSNFAEIAPYLKKQGLMHAQTQRGMAMDLDSFNKELSLPRELTVKEVATTEELRQWLRIYTDGFDYSSKLADFIFNNYGEIFLGTKKPARHYIAYYKGKPVATSSLFVTGNVAGLYNIVAVPEARHRGFGEALTLIPLIEAKKQGCVLAILQATDMGAGVYRKLGFEELCSLELYMKLYGSSQITFILSYMKKKIINYLRSLFPL
ncbi:MAG: hypothetical protein CVV44_11320 [Spirochaetae bacterium HGW-Spirochaetae-1]|jgi:ribosomal protein S18 acetylase RimI-like enzyme|nr:MAG: hypothetical protein CVV44_11320 [Spirochaetae bacterium HGW-Spirochaetae-1]